MASPRALAVNAYCSVSLEPPLVLVCLQKTSSTYPALFSSTHLGINVLGAGQRATVGVFARQRQRTSLLSWTGMKDPREAPSSTALPLASKPRSRNVSRRKPTRSSYAGSGTPRSRTPHPWSTKPEASIAARTSPSFERYRYFATCSVVRPIQLVRRPPHRRYTTSPRTNRLGRGLRDLTLARG